MNNAYEGQKSAGRKHHTQVVVGTMHVASILYGGQKELGANDAITYGNISNTTIYLFASFFITSRVGLSYSIMPFSKKRGAMHDKHQAHPLPSSCAGNPTLRCALHPSQQISAGQEFMIADRLCSRNEKGVTKIRTDSGLRTMHAAASFSFKNFTLFTSISKVATPSTWECPRRALVGFGAAGRNQRYVPKNAIELLYPAELNERDGEWWCVSLGANRPLPYLRRRYSVSASAGEAEAHDVCGTRRLRIAADGIEQHVPLQKLRYSR